MARPPRIYTDLSEVPKGVDTECVVTEHTVRFHEVIKDKKK